MAEWPTKLYADGHEYEDDLAIEVIPADLGRELYEAIRQTAEELDEKWRRRHGPIGGSPLAKKLRAALTRYEREVGE